MPSGWRNRGYLPHIDAPGNTQFLTWRLDDALPHHVLEKLQAEVSSLPENQRSRELLSRISAFLDTGFGECLLAKPNLGGLVQEARLRHHGSLYALHAWVVMPNHVHALLTPRPDVSLGKVMQQLKGATSAAIQRELGRSGRLWQPDYYDRLVSSPSQMEKIRQYIERNPVKAGLCLDADHWPLSSANRVARERMGLK